MCLHTDKTDWLNYYHIFLVVFRNLRPLQLFIILEGWISQEYIVDIFLCIIDVIYNSNSICL